MNVSEKRAKSKGHILCAFENRTDKVVHASSIDRIILDNCQGILIYNTGNFGLETENVSTG